MFGFKKKNYLKRTDFINSVDSNKLWSKSMTIQEIKDLLLFLENEISIYNFERDENFIMNSRRKILKNNIIGRLNKPDIVIEDILESLFNFWEFIADEYSGNIMSDCRELGISTKEFDTMDKAYREKGIICAQEKDLILEMIQEITKHLG